jgi:hypothetical protein
MNSDRFSCGMLLVISLLLGVLIARTFVRDSASAAPAGGVYRVVYVSGCEPGDPEKEAGEAEAKLNALAGQGWQVVASVGPCLVALRK